MLRAHLTVKVIVGSNLAYQPTNPASKTGDATSYAAALSAAAGPSKHARVTSDENPACLAR